MFLSNIHINTLTMKERVAIAIDFQIRYIFAKIVQVNATIMKTAI